MAFATPSIPSQAIEVCSTNTGRFQIGTRVLISCKYQRHKSKAAALCLVHGRGRGVQRGIVQAVLEREPLVVSFHDDTASHLGATGARLAD